MRVRVCSCQICLCAHLEEAQLFLSTPAFHWRHTINTVTNTTAVSRGGTHLTPLPTCPTVPTPQVKVCWMLNPSKIFREFMKDTWNFNAQTFLFKYVYLSWVCFVCVPSVCLSDSVQVVSDGWSSSSPRPVSSFSLSSTTPLPLTPHPHSSRWDASQGRVKQQRSSWYLVCVQSAPFSVAGCG